MSAPTRRRGPIPRDRDTRNDDPFRGLPDDFPAWHSRFPSIPSPGYGDLSFDPAAVKNSRAEGLTFKVTPEQSQAWLDVMKRALGDVVVDDTSDD